MLVLVLLVCGSAVPARAALESATSAAAIAAALDIDSAWLNSITLTSSLDTAPVDSQAVGVSTGTLGNYLPAAGGSFFVMSTGSIAGIPGGNDETGMSTDLGVGGKDDDGVQLKIVLNVPAGMNTFSFNWHFLSEEYPEYVGSAFNDFFFCEVGTSTISYAGNTPASSTNVIYDYAGKIMSVNSDFFNRDATHTTGTEFDGETKLLRTCIPCTPGGTLTLYFTIADMGDAILDSALFLDNFLFSRDRLNAPITVDAITAAELGKSQREVEPVAYPNPFIPSRGTMTFEASNSGCGVFQGIRQVEIFTLYGVLVRTLSGNGGATVEWDGRNAQGSPVASGMYVYTIATVDNTVGKGRFTLVR